ncbi:MerR family transcriptional regulator, partial [Streptomyces cacaoi]|uniref:MerR family transcriptional regulator n=1 Tax=Streptomyces cacaoi TaxID=1898 RepID=UPI0037478C85
MDDTDRAHRATRDAPARAGTGNLMSISAFARRVGLAPSALRFYDDCGVLSPAAVDPVTGYRSYSPQQHDRAVLLRRLRTAGLPLTGATAVLDGPRDEALRVLEQHARTARAEAEAARSALDGVLADLRGERPARARVDGAELAAALTGVAPAAATGAARDRFPVLGRVLLELDGDELHVVATDRYRLAVRTLRADGHEGGPARIAVAAEETARLARWALLRPRVRVADGPRAPDGGPVLRCTADGPDAADEPDAAGGPGAGDGPGAAVTAVTADGPGAAVTAVTADGPGAAVTPVTADGPGAADAPGIADAPGAAAEDPSADDTLLLAAHPETYPDHRLVLEGLPPARHRLITDREALRTAVSRAPAPFVILRTDGQRLTIRHGDAGPERDQPALSTGPPLRIAFDPRVLGAALDAGVGPDVLLEIASAADPVVVRSADQGSFTTLVMPVHGSAA